MSKQTRWIKNELYFKCIYTLGMGKQTSWMKNKQINVFSTYDNGEWENKPIG